MFNRAQVLRISLFPTLPRPVSGDPVPYHSKRRVEYALAFYVDGTTIPEVDWDVGPSWAGLIPISGDKNERRKVSVPSV
jgi:hypothetical protein